MHAEDLQSQLLAAINDFELAEVVHILETHKRNPGLHNLHLEEALLAGVRSSHTEILKILLKYNRVSCVTFADNQGKRALHHAAESGSTNMIKMILQAGSAVNVIDAEGLTALHYVCKFGHLDAIKLLIKEGAHVNRAKTFVQGETPLHLAASAGHFSAAKLLLERRADINLTTITDQATPLHKATRGHHPGIVRMLCEYGADIHVPDASGRTPLHLAAEAGMTEIVQVFIDIGAKIEVTDFRNRTPLHCAVSTNKAQVVQTLIEYGASVNSSDIDGCRPLHSAARKGSTDIAAMLVSAGADVNAPEGTKGESALCIAVAHGRVELVELLLALGADINQADDTRATALHRVMSAREPARTEMVHLLIRNGSRINVLDSRGYTPLDRQVFQGMLHSFNQDILKLLVCSGAHLRPVKGEGLPHHNSPLTWLTWHGDLSLARLLVEVGWDLKDETWIDLPGRNEAQTEFLEWMRTVAKQPRILLQVCRVSIREHLINASKDTEILSLLERLPLPTILRNYLMFREEFSEIDST